MKKVLSIALSMVIVFSCFFVCGYAVDIINRIDLTVYSEIGNLQYSDFGYIYTIDTEGFNPLNNGPLLVYYNNQPYYDGLIVGKTYTLVVNIYRDGQMKIGEDFNIFINNESLDSLDDYMIVYNPESDRTLIKIIYDVTVTAVAYKNYLGLTINMPEGKTIGWKNKAEISAPISGYMGPFQELLDTMFIGWYEGDNLLSVTKADALANVLASNGSRVHYFSTERLKTSHTYTARIVVYDGSEYTVVSRFNQEKSITINVKTGFVDKITYFFQRLFGQDTVVEIKYIPEWA